MLRESFSEKLAAGLAGESVIASYYRRKGWDVLPVYEKAFNDHKGPRFFTAAKELVAPDLLLMRPDRFCWIEVKRKTSFTWHRISRRWTTGIDRRHYEDYLEIAKRYPDLYLLFLHETSFDRTHPAVPCPTGLFGGRIDRLQKCVNHQSDNYARGMVYWALQSLTLIAPLEDLEDVDSIHRHTRSA
jgi:hypothetical protein